MKEEAVDRERSVMRISKTGMDSTLQRRENLRETEGNSVKWLDAHRYRASTTTLGHGIGTRTIPSNTIMSHPFLKIHKSKFSVRTNYIVKCSMNNEYFLLLLSTPLPIQYTMSSPGESRDTVPQFWKRRKLHHHHSQQTESR